MKKPKRYVLIDWAYETYDGNGREMPEINGVVFGNKVCLMVNSAKVLQELFIQKNKYYDKHPSTERILKRVIGDSILFQKSD